MADVITGAKYLELATLIADARAKQIEVPNDLYEAVLVIAALDDVYPTYDLIQKFVGVYQYNVDQATNSSTLISAVRALNSHVKARGNYPTVNDFLDDNSITVPQLWADLSASVGDVIDPLFITP